jgi:hypothetical protein
VTGKVVVNRAMSLDGFVSGPVLPVLLGRGTRLFTGASLDRVNLEPISSTASAGITAMRFRVVQPCAS